MTTWNHVVLGDGTRAVLVPGVACANVITEADGHRSCNHTDATACDRSGHETISLYEVIREGEPGYFPPGDLGKCENCGKPMAKHGPLAECFPERASGETP